MSEVERQHAEAWLNAALAGDTDAAARHRDAGLAAKEERLFATPTRMPDGPRRGSRRRRARAV